MPSSQTAKTSRVCYDPANHRYWPEGGRPGTYTDEEAELADTLTVLDLEAQVKPCVKCERLTHVGNVSCWRCWNREKPYGG